MSAKADPNLPDRPRNVMAAGLLMLAVGLAWHGSFGGPFVLDDRVNIVTNATLHNFGALGRVLTPPPNSGVGGRPVLNLSFALSHAMGGLDVRGYHVANLLIHFCASFALFAFVRRTLLTRPLQARFGRAAGWLAIFAALLWALHPVQTQAITYLSQRAEALMALFYLLTLYLFLRGATAHDPLRWHVASVATCALGMATKEVMVTAPVLVLLYDRTFLAGTFRAALRERGRFYLALAATWLLLAVLMADVSERGIGPVEQVSRWNYALTECEVVLHYLRLAVLPTPLVFDYAPVFATSLSAVAGSVVLLAPLLAATLFAVVRRPALGFLGAWFFVILAPTSSIVPIVSSPMAESRLYLPLASFAVGVVLALHAFIGGRSLRVFALVALAFVVLVVRRNRDYRSEESLWVDTIAKQPSSARAHYVLGLTLARQGRLNEAIPLFHATLRLDPDYPDVENNLANSIATLGQFEPAVKYYQDALRHHPEETAPRSNLASALLHLGRLDEAERQGRLAVQQRPRDGVAQHILALVLEQRGATDAAIAAYETALRLTPALVQSRENLGLLLLREKRFAEAELHFQAIVATEPGRLGAQRALSQILLATGRNPEARRQAQEFVRRFPDSPEPYLLLGQAEAALAQPVAARAALQRALQLRPGYPEALAALAALQP